MSEMRFCTLGDHVKYIRIILTKCDSVFCVYNTETRIIDYILHRGN